MKRKIGLLLMAVTLVLLGVVTAAAQQPPPPDQADQPGPPRMPHDPLGDVLSPPEMIMSHQREPRPHRRTEDPCAAKSTKRRRALTNFSGSWDAMEALGITMKRMSSTAAGAGSAISLTASADQRLHMELAIRPRTS